MTRPFIRLHRRDDFLVRPNLLACHSNPDVSGVTALLLGKARVDDVLELARYDERNAGGSHCDGCLGGDDEEQEQEGSRAWGVCVCCLIFIFSKSRQCRNDDESDREVGVCDDVRACCGCERKEGDDDECQCFSVKQDL